MIGLNYEVSVQAAHTNNDFGSGFINFRLNSMYDVYCHSSCIHCSLELPLLYNYCNSCVILEKKDRCFISSPLLRHKI